MGSAEKYPGRLFSLEASVAIRFHLFRSRCSMLRCLRTICCGLCSVPLGLLWLTRVGSASRRKSASIWWFRCCALAFPLPLERVPGLVAHTASKWLDTFSVMFFAGRRPGCNRCYWAWWVCESREFPSRHMTRLESGTSSGWALVGSCSWRQAVDPFRETFKYYKIMTMGKSVCKVAEPQRMFHSRKPGSSAE